MKCFHGTSVQTYNRMMSGSEKPENTTWKVSNDGLLYVWVADWIHKEWGFEGGNREQYCISESFASGSVTSASRGEFELVVLEFDVPEKKIEQDLSCGRTEMRGAGTINSMFPLQFLTKIHRLDKSIKKQAPMILARFLYHNLFNWDSVPLELIEEAKEMNRSYIPFKDVYSFRDGSYTTENIEFIFSKIYGDGSTYKSFGFSSL